MKASDREFWQCNHNYDEIVEIQNFVAILFSSLYQENN